MCNSVLYVLVVVTDMSKFGCIFAALKGVPFVLDEAFLVLEKACKVSDTVIFCCINLR